MKSLAACKTHLATEVCSSIWTGWDCEEHWWCISGGHWQWPQRKPGDCVCKHYRFNCTL